MDSHLLCFSSSEVFGCPQPHRDQLQVGSRHRRLVDNRRLPGREPGPHQYPQRRLHLVRSPDATARRFPHLRYLTLTSSFPRPPAEGTFTCGQIAGWLEQTCPQATAAGRLWTPPLRRPARAPSAVAPPPSPPSATVRSSSSTTLRLCLPRFVEQRVKSFPLCISVAGLGFIRDCRVRR